MAACFVVCFWISQDKVARSLFFGWRFIAYWYYWLGPGWPPLLLAPCLSQPTPVNFPTSHPPYPFTIKIGYKISNIRSTTPSHKLRTMRRILPRPGPSKKYAGRFPWLRRAHCFRQWSSGRRRAEHARAAAAAPPKQIKFKLVLKIYSAYIRNYPDWQAKFLGGAAPSLCLGGLSLVLRCLFRN